MRTVEQDRPTSRSLELLRSAKWYLLGVAIAVACGVFALSSQRASTYESSALAQIVPGADRSRASTSDEIQTATNTYLTLADTTPVIEKAEQLLHRKVADPRNTFSVAASEDVAVLKFTGASKDGAQSVKFANAYATAFAEYVTQRERAEATRALGQIQNQIAAVEQRLARTSSSRDPLAAGLEASLQTLQNQAAEEAVAPRDAAKLIERAADANRVSPQPFRDALLALLLSTLLGSGIVMAGIARRDRYTDAWDVALDLSLPILAEIPKQRASEDRVTLEAFRNLRERIGSDIRSRRRSSGVGEEARTAILITSPESGSGKTFTATNLARAFVAAEREALLIDADLRRPSVHTEFRLPLEPGLSTWLRAGQNGRSPDPNAAVRHTIAVEGSGRDLEIVTAGAPGDDAAEVLGASRMATFMLEAVRRNDPVLIDSPPTGGIADSLVLTRHVDFVVLVVDAHRTRPQQARRAVEILRAVDAEVVGVVYNRSTADFQRYGAYYTSTTAESV